MLNDFQINRVWKGMLDAETRSLYFADLASRYTRRKQWITGVSFFFSSGAAAAVVSKAPDWVPVALAITVAAATAYSVAVNLDGRISTMAKLHAAWNSIASDYDRLWNHAYADDAEEQFYRILKNEKEPSELAATDAPNDQKLLEHWQLQVFSQYHLREQPSA